MSKTLFKWYVCQVRSVKYICVSVKLEEHGWRHRGNTSEIRRTSFIALHVGFDYTVQRKDCLSGPYGFTADRRVRIAVSRSMINAKRKIGWKKMIHPAKRIDSARRNPWNEKGDDTRCCCHTVTKSRGFFVKASCEKQDVIVRFTCKSCSASYIGKTSGPFYLLCIMNIKIIYKISLALILSALLFDKWFWHLIF